MNRSTPTAIPTLPVHGRISFHPTTKKPFLMTKPARETGRFINCDDPNYIGLYDTAISYNPFAYCLNDSINSIDWTGCYSVAKSCNYAKKWWNNYNKQYYRYYTSGDCANFISQCLFAGGLLMDNVWFSYRSSKKPLGKDSSKWAKRKFSNYYYRVSDAWSLAGEIYAYLANKYYVISYSNKTGKSYFLRDVHNRTIKEGDVAFFENSENGIHHAVLIGKVVLNDCYYYAHSTNRKANKRASIVQVLKRETIHIVRIR